MADSPPPADPVAALTPEQLPGEVRLLRAKIAEDGLLYAQLHEQLEQALDFLNFDDPGTVTPYDLLARNGYMTDDDYPADFPSPAALRAELLAQRQAMAEQDKLNRELIVELERARRRAASTVVWQAWLEDSDNWNGDVLYADRATAEAASVEHYLDSEGIGADESDDPDDVAEAAASRDRVRASLCWQQRGHTWDLLHGRRATGVHVQERTVEAPDRPASEAHPEDYCNRCGGPNVPWSVSSPLWNKVMRGDDINEPAPFNGIICLVCFARLAEQMGIAQGWRVFAEQVHMPLTTVTPTGRIWNDATWLWEEPPADAAELLARVNALPGRPNPCRRCGKTTCPGYGPTSCTPHTDRL